MNLPVKLGGGVSEDRIEREDRGAKGVERGGVWEGVSSSRWGGAVHSPRKMFRFFMGMVHFGGFWSLIL